MTTNSFDYNKTYYKLTSQSLKNRDFKFKEGLNILKDDFDPEGDCTKGGFYFCSLENIGEWLFMYPNGFIFEVCVPKEAQVIVQNKKFKTNQLILNNSLIVGEFIKKHNIEKQIIHCCSMNICFVEQTDELCMLAINKNPSTIRLIKNASEVVCLEAVKKDGYAIKHIKNPSENICMQAVISHPYSCQHIKNPSNNVLLEALKHDFSLVVHMNDIFKNIYTRHSDELIFYQINAVRKNSNVIKYIKNPSEQVCLEAVKQNGLVIQFIDDPSNEVCLEAVKQNYTAIQYIWEPSDNVLLEALRTNHDAFKYIYKYSEEIAVEFIKKDISVFKYINHPSAKLCLEAIKQNGLIIQFIDNPSNEVCLEAVRQNGLALQFIDNPSNEVCLEAVKQNKDAYKKIVEEEEEDEEEEDEDINIYY
jgi:hypothetical protein